MPASEMDDQSTRNLLCSYDRKCYGLVRTVEDISKSLARTKNDREFS